jgi:hypothetical protein
LYYANFSDQLLYKYDGTNATPLTKEGYRYADFVVDEKNARIVSVREDHTDKNRKEPVNSIVSYVAKIKGLTVIEYHLKATTNKFWSVETIFILRHVYHQRLEPSHTCKQSLTPNNTTEPGTIQICLGIILNFAFWIMMKL